MNFEDKIKKFSSENIAILNDDFAGSGRAVLFTSALGLKESGLNKMLEISGSQVYVTLEPKRVSAFELEPMLRSSLFNNQNPNLSMLQSVEAREGIHTGISISDRTKTIQILSASEPNPNMLVKPGHVFPVQISEGGVLVRAGLMEAAADITSLICDSKVSVVVDLLDSNGNYPDSESIHDLASKNGLQIFSLSELIAYRLNNTPIIEKLSEADLPLGSGTIFRISAYHSKLDSVEHVALSLGAPFDASPVLVRVHKENLFADLFSQSSGSVLRKSIEIIEKKGRGLIVYLRASQKDAFAQHKKNLQKSTIFRDYGTGAQIIKDCGVKKLSLLVSSNIIPDGLESFGLQIEEIINVNS